MTELSELRPKRKTLKRQLRREKRAAATRAKALSPARIVALIASLPLVMCSTALGVYIRTSPYPAEQALQHLVAMAGCEAAAKVGVFEVREGMAGYHASNDHDGNGVACEVQSNTASLVGAEETVQAARVSAPAAGNTERRSIGNAKFIRP
ncbi:excalibur calcium-binding domain-containing protein [Ruegeria sp. 2205SS24-7]|uniref:excalibur calcium-binding domain-containing protein n=1 Tax=Ruegeria discodermiae TaxID=3064389 RepID=UPI0027420F94|nr:excalibur calcium-binding domain-containing protein [Ruegeria sp. 2205SS24-7]MDP5219322.1 excalibur calcium-binding domain-containing protein [Ruegeria sp. 2205SS24-7]